MGWSLICRSPEGAPAGGGGQSAPAAKAPTAGGAAQKAIQTKTPVGKAPAKAPAKAAAPAGKPLPKGPGGVAQVAPAEDDGGRDPSESAADRAMARKARADAEGKKTPTRTKVKSLSDIRKLHSSRVPEEEQPEGEVEIDEGAKPNPNPALLERGRPDPKVKTKTPLRQQQEPTVEDIAADEVQAAAADDGVADPELVDPNAEVEEPAEEEEYTPNLKYKAFGEEHEVPEIFQPLLTSADNERQVHDMLTKAGAFERTKLNATAYQKQVEEQLVPEVMNYRGIAQELTEVAQTGDIFELASRFGIDETKVLTAALKHAELLQASPEVQAEAKRRRDAERQNRQLAKRLEATESRVSESEKHAMRNAFESLLARDDVRAVEADFDGKFNGKQGTFRKMVAQFADQDYQRKAQAAAMGRGPAPKALTPEEAVQGFMQAYGLEFPTTGNPAPKPNPAPNPALRGQQATAQAAKPTPKPKVIPNLNGRHSAGNTGKPIVKSVADLRKLAKEMKTVGR